VARDGPLHHITIAHPVEYTSADQLALLLRLLPYARNDYRVVGLGRITSPAPSSADASASTPVENEVLFLVVEWPSMNSVRVAAGLPLHQFHITLGFSYYDVHGPAADKTARALVDALVDA
jgi:hypothetical protein